LNSFLALLDGEACNGDQLCVAERAEYSGTAEPIGEPTQRLCIFNLEGATERFWVGLEGLQSNVSIKDSIGCVLLCETTYLNVVGAHPSFFAPRQGKWLNRAIPHVSHNI
jgi:hypothetical protein